MADDTAAVLEAPASDVPEQPVDVQPEIPETPAPETPEAEPETESPPVRSIDDYSEDELREHPKFKDLLARNEESIRRKSENEATKRMAAQQAKVVARDSIANTIGGLLNAVRQFGEDNPGQQIDPNWIQQQAMQIANAASGHYFRETSDLFSGLLASKTPQEHKFTAEQMTKLQSLHEDVQAGRVHPLDLYDYRLDLLAEAKVAAQLPKLKQEWEKEYRAAEKARAETNSLRTNDAQRGSQPRPTTGGSASAPVDARSILDSASPTDPAYRAAYKEVHGIEPPW